MDSLVENFGFRAIYQLLLKDQTIELNGHMLPKAMYLFEVHQFIKSNISQINGSCQPAKITLLSVK
jgi:hypothetical protein